MNAYVLLEHEEDTGAATRRVGFAAVNDEKFAVSFIPDESDGTWLKHADRCEEMFGGHPNPDQFEQFLDEANGLTWGALAIDELPEDVDEPYDVVVTFVDNVLEKRPTSFDM